MIEGDPLHNVDNRLIIVDTEAQDFGSGAGTVVVVLDGGGVFGLLHVATADVPGPAAFDSLKSDSCKKSDAYVVRCTMYTLFTCTKVQRLIRLTLMALGQCLFWKIYLLAMQSNEVLHPRRGRPRA